MEILKTEALSYTYALNEEKTLENINFSLEEGTFTLLVGASGCGKTTLLSQMKKNSAQKGTSEGTILFRNQNLSNMESEKRTAAIGFVGQNPENQIVTNKVWHELAFGLENLGISRNRMEQKIGEMTEFFGMREWLQQDTATLSGGQMQLLNLAAVMIMEPEILLLDEPLGQLDPLAAQSFLQMIKRINTEFATTILMAEHNLETVFPMADQILYMADGTIQKAAAPREMALWLREEQFRENNEKSTFYAGLPAAFRIMDGIGTENINESLPLTVREGQKALEKTLSVETKTAIRKRKITESRKNEGKEKNGAIHDGRKSQKEKTVIALKDISCRYAREKNDILRHLDLAVYPEEIFCILGGNGSGKSTLLKVLTSTLSPWEGKIEILGKTCKKKTDFLLGEGQMVLLPQNPKALFTEITVEEELKEVFGRQKETLAKDREEACQKMLQTMELEPLAKKNPYDLSGGEQQRLALGKLLLLKPRVLLLDEPSKGLDPGRKNALKRMLQKLKNQKMTMVMVSHDLEFAAETADRCGLLFDGRITAIQSTRSFFAGNRFYTTAACRMARPWFEDAVTCEEVIEAWKCEEKKKLFC